MERNTIQIQHKKFRISNLQKFDLTGFCLPYFNRSTVCWTRVRSVPEPRPLPDLLWLMPFSSITSGSPNCWTSNVLHVQNWRKAIYKKYWNLLIRNYSAGLFSGTSLTKKQPRNTFLQSLYSMHRRVSASHWLRIRPGLLQSAPTFLSFCPDAVSAFLQK